ncbi:MAG: cob(I)yrinic acid a,c-diamide adenosyltransferase [Gammaproteobacteria bacterium]
MGHRLSKIYTRTGDAGTTGLGDGSRIDKHAPRMEAIGEVDELNCNLGLLLTETLREDMHALLIDIQHDLFDLGGELSIPDSAFITAGAVTKLEQGIDRYNEELPPLKEFLLPGGSRAAAIAHLCRAVCRRAERRVLGLAADSPVNPHALMYLNRLSDLLFVCARIVARDSGAGEVMWQRGRG